MLSPMQSRETSTRCRLSSTVPASKVPQEQTGPQGLLVLRARTGRPAQPDRPGRAVPTATPARPDPPARKETQELLEQGHRERQDQLVPLVRRAQRGTQELLEQGHLVPPARVARQGLLVLRGQPDLRAPMVLRA
jgi:hypothetical protein